jgi:IS5 family transposase
VQGVTRMDQDLWDAQDVAGALVPDGGVFAFLAAHRRELFDDSFTADLFPSGTGRPSLPADLVGAVLVLKELYGLSDSQTVEALMYDIRWKVACGRSLMAMSFDRSTLVYWRKRIAASDRPDRVFDKLGEVITETGILRGRRKRCVDSTVFDDAVATQDTVTQLVAAIRKVARVVPGAPEVIAAVCTVDYGQAGKPDIDWDDPQAKKDLVSALVNDALAVLAALCRPGAPQRDPAAADALGLLALVAGQDVEPAEGSDGTDGRWVIARKVAPDRVISTVDTQARHTRKSKSQRRDGYRGHVATEPDTGLITDCEMTMATGQDNTDAAVGVKMAGRDRFHHTTKPTDETIKPTAETIKPTAETIKPTAEPGESVVISTDTDEPVVTSSSVDTVETADIQTDVNSADILEPAADTSEPVEPAADTSEPVEPAADTSEPGADASTVPTTDADKPSSTSVDTGEAGDTDTTDTAADSAGAGSGLEVYGDCAYGSGEARDAYRKAGHDAVIKPKPVQPAVPGGFTLDDFVIDQDEASVTCPGGHTRPMSPTRTVTFGKLCATCPLRQRCTTAKAGRSMTIHEYEALLRAARAQARTPQFKKDYPTRSNVERTVAQVATQNGRRVKLRYRGTTKNDAWLHTRAAALNLRTLVKRGLTRTDGAWAFA